MLRQSGLLPVANWSLGVWRSLIRSRGKGHSVFLEDELEMMFYFVSLNVLQRGNRDIGLHSSFFVNPFLCIFLILSCLGITIFDETLSTQRTTVYEIQL